MTRAAAGQRRSGLDCWVCRQPWSEKLDDRRLFDRIAFPRLSAIAESAWTPSVGKDFGRFQAVHALMPGLSVE